MGDIDLRNIRRIIVTAISSDDYLMTELVLKGGNALELAYNVGNRASVDLDYSMAAEFSDIDEAGRRLHTALRERFDAIGMVLIDYEFGPRPETAVVGVRWGGYRALFKLVRKDLFIKYRDDQQRLRMSAMDANPEHGRSFTIDISRYEYVDDAQEIEIDNYTVKVASPRMIAIEKLRALCQQMKEYTQRAHPTQRARDLYDIYTTITSCGLDLLTESSLTMLRDVFAAKEVPIQLLAELPRYREFHRAGWPAVTNAVRQKTEEYDFYYDFVEGLARVLLQTVGIVDSPR